MDRAKAAKLIRMLSSSNHGEVQNAAALLTKLGIHEVAELIEGGPGSRKRWGDKTTEVKLRTEVNRVQAELKRVQAELKHSRDTAADLKLALKSMAQRMGPARTCVMCKNPFTAARSDATTCSPRCRTALHRKRARK